MTVRVGIKRFRAHGPVSVCVQAGVAAYSWIVQVNEIATDAAGSAHLLRLILSTASGRWPAMRQETRCSSKAALWRTAAMLPTPIGLAAIYRVEGDRPTP